ncbi:hypothetical protein [Nocardia cyriacigeorgica]|nr:hypothetical protein [Nocardia cyriacigeorgica]
MTAERWVILRRRIRPQPFAIPGRRAERPPIIASAPSTIRRSRPDTP